MRLILHIGTEKTGSTAIQQHLQANRLLISEQGVHCCDTAGRGNHRALVAAFMPPDVHDDFLRGRKLVQADARSAWREAFLDAFAAEVEAAKADAESFIVTSEHFHSRLDQPAGVMELAAFLRPLFSDITVVCYLRRQVEMALSFYSEKLRAGFIPPEILPLSNVRRRVGSLPPYFDFESFLNRWSDALGERCIAPRLYQAASLDGGDVVQDFFQVAGLGSPGVRLPETANPSLCMAAQGALRRYNECCGGHDVAARDLHRQRRQRFVDYLQAQGGEDRGQLPTLQEASAFYAAFAASNSRVAERWFRRERLFDEDFSMYPEQSRSADWEAITDLFAGFLASRSTPAPTPEPPAEC